MAKQIPCRRAFTETLLELARHDPSIVVLTTDARGSVTLNDFARELPEQFVEVGIAEQNMVGMAAGLARCGKRPFICAPACFLSARSLEQIKVDISYSRTNVKVIGVSGGVSYGSLGSTHHSLHDIAVMRALPNLAVVLPCDRHQTKALTNVLATYPGSVYVRMGRAAVPEVYKKGDTPFEIGRANQLLEGKDATIIGTGETVHIALQAGNLLRREGIGVRVLDMHTIKPLDVDAVLAAATETGKIITVEEHSIYGGLGAAVAEAAATRHPVPIKMLAIPDEHVLTGNSTEVFHHYGITADNIKRVVCEMLGLR